MQRANQQKVHDLVTASLTERIDSLSHCPIPIASRFGRIVEIGPTLLRASLPGVGLGELCLIEPQGLEAEVVSVKGDFAWLLPFGEPFGISVENLVSRKGEPHSISVGEHLLGSIIDGLGRPLDDKVSPDGAPRRGLENTAPNPLTRTLIDTPLPLGVRAIDAMMTCGEGQRIGIFAAAGGGKSTLLGMICGGCSADVIVLALIGERGREVRELLEQTLPEQSRQRSVIIIATSDRPATERLKAAYTATTVAEYFRDQGKKVLLMMDSLTRFARAAREIGLAAGEQAVAGSYPASFFARLPRLLERAGPAKVGSITGIYTVLVEGDDMNEPVADEVRSILDGHIVLSRQLAQAHHYPAIDVSASVSRIMHQVTSDDHRRQAGKLRRLLAAHKEIELLVRVGEYQAGQDTQADEALARKEAIQAFLCQRTDEKNAYEQTLEALWKTTEGQL